jgi:MFS family permease
MKKMNYALKLTLFFGITWGLAGLDRCLTGYAAPGFMVDLKLNFTQLGLIVTLSALAATLGGFIFNPISEYYGRRVGTVWGNIGQHLLSALTGLVQSFGQMTIMRSVMAFGNAGMHGPSFAAIAEEAPPEKRGFLMGLAMSFWPLIGMGMGPIVAGYLMTTVGWRYSFFLIAIPGICIAIYSDIHARTAINRREYQEKKGDR